MQATPRHLHAHLWVNRPLPGTISKPLNYTFLLIKGLCYKLLPFKLNCGFQTTPHKGQVGWSPLCMSLFYPDI
jgi:hypothetical protein